MIFGKKKKDPPANDAGDTENKQLQKTAAAVPAPQKTPEPEELKPVRTFEEDLAEAIAKRDEAAENKQEHEKKTAPVPQAPEKDAREPTKIEPKKHRKEASEKLPEHSPETTLQKSPSLDHREAAEKQLEDISLQKKRLSEEINTLEEQASSAKEVIGRFTEEKESLNSQLTPIKEQEALVENSIIEVEKREASASAEERRSFEEHRWELEGERKKLESKKWELSKEVEKIEDSIRKSEATHAEIQSKKKLALEQLENLDREEKRIRLKLELTEVSKKKQALEFQWITLNNKNNEQEALLQTTIEEEKSTEKEKQAIEGKEHAAQSSQEERGFEEKRQEIEGKRKGLEEKRWEVEEALAKTKKAIEKLKPEYQEALGTEERLNKALADLDTK